MKKALIAVAVAGAFAAPSAMAAELSTNVYWSTAITMGETTTTAADGTSTGVDRGEVQDAGGNRLMFTWTDTLDNGVGVNAYLSFGNLGTANLGGVNVRNANIGFSGDFGKVQVGTNEHFSETDLLFDPSFGDFGNTGDAISYIQLGQSGFNFTRRDGESVWFTSNDMNGIQLRAAYIFGSQNQTAAADPEGTQIGLSYTSGPLRVGINQATYSDYSANGGGTDASAFALLNGAASAAVQGSEAQMTTLLASYDLGVVNIKAAQWSIEQDGISVTSSTGATATGIEATGRSIYLGMPVGGGTLWAQSSTLSDQDQTVAGVTTAIANSGKSGWDVGYHHAMNSQVNFFVRYGVSESEIEFNDDTQQSAAGAVTDGADTATEISEFMFGWQLMY